MFLEVEENPNCKAMDMMRFKELGPPRRLKQVRLYDRVATGEWFEITGWSGHTTAPACPAYACPIEDSGSGVAYLVYGGNHGIRLRPVEPSKSWSLTNPDQWGEPHLILSSPQDLRYDDTLPQDPR